MQDRSGAPAQNTAWMMCCGFVSQAPNRLNMVHTSSIPSGAARRFHSRTPEVGAESDVMAGAECFPHLL